VHLVSALLLSWMFLGTDLHLHMQYCSCTWTSCSPPVSSAAAVSRQPCEGGSQHGMPQVQTDCTRCRKSVVAGQFADSIAAELLAEADIADSEAPHILLAVLWASMVRILLESA